MENGVHVQIMWKEIAIIFLIIYLLRCLTDFYIINKFKKLHKAFCEGEWDGLETEMIKHRNICKVFSGGPFNKNIRRLYNGLCLAVASIRLMKNDEEAFLQELIAIKNEAEYVMKPFVLSLYYYSKNDQKEAIEQYQKYLDSNPKNKSTQDILEYLYEEKKERPVSAIEGFSNPAILKLLRECNVL